MTAPSVVVGIPVYGGGEHLKDALESLLGQTYRDVAYIVVDDASPQPALELARRYAGNDPRVTLERNPRRLGLAGNWRWLVELAAERFPDATWFAWGSDHDVWHPRFIEELVGELSSSPDAVLAYPLVVRFGASDTPPVPPWRFETRAVGDPSRRLRLVARRMVAGDMIYGVFRLEALVAAGGFPVNMLPDRLLLADLARTGRFLQVPRILWYRRMTAIASAARQRTTLFGPEGPPLRAWLPWWAIHAAELGRRHGPRVGLEYGLISARTSAVGRARRLLGTLAHGAASWARSLRVFF